MGYRKGIDLLIDKMNHSTKEVYEITEEITEIKEKREQPAPLAIPPVVPVSAPPLPPRPLCCSDSVSSLPPPPVPQAYPVVVPPVLYGPGIPATQMVQPAYPIQQSNGVYSNSVTTNYSYSATVELYTMSNCRQILFHVQNAVVWFNRLLERSIFGVDVGK